MKSDIDLNQIIAFGFSLILVSLAFYLKVYSNTTLLYALICLSVVNLIIKEKESRINNLGVTNNYYIFLFYSVILVDIIVSERNFIPYLLFFIPICIYLIYYIKKALPTPYLFKMLGMLLIYIVILAAINLIIPIKQLGYELGMILYIPFTSVFEYFKKISTIAS